MRKEQSAALKLNSLVTLNERGTGVYFELNGKKYEVCVNSYHPGTLTISSDDDVIQVIPGASNRIHVK